MGEVVGWKSGTGGGRGCHRIAGNYAGKETQRCSPRKPLERRWMRLLLQDESPGEAATRRKRRKSV